MVDKLFDELNICLKNSYKERTYKLHHIKIYNYILNNTKFLSEDASFSERKYCIKNNITERPKCIICGKEITYTTLYNNTCSNECYLKYKSLQSKQMHLNRSSNDKKLIQNKIKLKFIEKYGVENPFQSQIIKDKIKQDNLKKYGCEHYQSTDEYKKKTKHTNLERYGVENYAQTDMFKKLYTSEFIKNRDIKNKQTCLEKYGFETQLLDKNIQSKRYNTMKLHNSFNKSKPEDKVYEILLEKYKGVQRQYKSEKYPFNCDFYIPSEDLYIECNFHWTHGNKPYQNINEDNIIINKWKSKNTKFYNIAINTWTIRDVEKLRIAKENNLNYQIFYSLEEFMEKYKNG